MDSGRWMVRADVAAILRMSGRLATTSSLIRATRKPGLTQINSRREVRNEAIDAALDLVVFRKDVLKSLEKVAGKGGVKKFF